MRPVTNPATLSLPLYSHSVPAGFPSPADDYVSETLDLNEHLISHKEATFFLKAKGHSMTGAGIQDGDPGSYTHLSRVFHSHGNNQQSVPAWNNIAQLGKEVL